METKTLIVNDIPRRLLVNPDEMLADVLRAQLHLTSVKVGCGKGRFLVARAAANPDCDFLGIERMLERVRLFAGKCRRGGVANARVLGVLLNNVDTTAGDYYYGGYYNYYSYGVDSRDGRGGGNRPGFFERARRTLAGLGKRQTPSGNGQDRRRPRHG